MDMQALHTSVEAIEEVAEDFLLGRLSASDLRAYEQHLMVCDPCRRAVETTDEFIELFRDAVFRSSDARDSRVA
jgi:anti-sigma factor RsiW